MLSSIMLVIALQQQPVSPQFPDTFPQVTSPSAFQDRAPSNMQLLAGYRAAVLTAHQRHVRHLGHLAHLRYLRTLAAQAAAAASARRGSVTTAVAVTASTGAYGHPNFCGDGDGDGWDVPCATRDAAPVRQAVAVQASVQQAPAPQRVSTGGSYQQCVISRESGGNPRAVNASSGAGGLYQFLPSTWASLGYSGAPQDASVATQNAAFAKLYATAGTSPWSPSDGC